MLGVSAAHRLGVGMTRFVASDFVAETVLAVRPEAVRVSLDSSELPNCDAWVLGSGVSAAVQGASAGHADWIRRVLRAGSPAVVDAGALELADLGALEGRRIITPHAGEAVRLMARFGVAATREEIEADLVGAALQLANLSGAVVLLKGNRSVVAAPGDVYWRAHSAPAELATAGTGDVLAGLLGALLATNAKEDLYELAQLGVWLHSQAAFEAAVLGPIAALDVADQLRKVVGRAQRGGFEVVE